MEIERGSEWVDTKARKVPVAVARQLDAGNVVERVITVRSFTDNRWISYVGEWRKLTPDGHKVLMRREGYSRVDSFSGDRSKYQLRK